MTSSLSERARHRAAALVSGVVLLLGRPLHAAPGDPVGGQFQLNDFTTLAQSEPKVAPDGAGGFVVVWQSFASTGTDADAFSVQARRFTPTGTPLGAEFQVNTYTTGSQREPEVATFGGGGFVVIWQSASSGTDPAVSVAGQLFDAAGMPVGGEFQVNTYTTDAQYSPAVASDAAGGFVVVWNSEGSAGTDADDVSIQARRFDATGTPAGPEFQVNTYTTGAQHYPNVGSDGAGGLVVVWTSNGSAGSDASLSSVQGQRFDVGGNPVAGEFQVNTYTTGEQLYPVATGMGAGGFVVLWMSDGSSGTDTSGLSIQMQRYDAAGVPAGGQFQVNTYTTTTQDKPQVGLDGAGGFVAVWESAGSTRHDLAGAWSYLGKVGQNKGYKWKSASLPFRTIVIKRGKLVKIAGRGAGLGFDLDDNPNPVRVELGIGGQLYCFELAGEAIAFKAGKRYAARRAGAPGACP